MDKRRVNAIRGKLLSWYAVEARDLPWRRTIDPYAILVSEFMLQQTRVETVLRYYEPFLDRFPTLRALAGAPIDDVLKAWEGLGYYRRAHNLHRAAQVVASEHGGTVPRTVKELRALPGIGPYTAAAVASIAFGLDEPVLDGNVIRVVSRLFRIGGDPTTAKTRKALLGVASQLTSAGDASHVNQGLMDLGARICLPRSPRCHECPIASECNAHHAGEEIAYPEKPARKRAPHIDVVAGVIWDSEPSTPESRILIARRRTGDMLGGLWEFPGGRVEDGETNEQALARELREELGIDTAVGAFLVDIDHAYTHFRMTMHVFHVRHTGGQPRAIECDDWRWVSVEKLSDFAFSAADQQVLSALRGASNRD